MAKNTALAWKEPQGHVLHAEANLQILDAVLAGVAASRIPFHRRSRVFIRAISGDGVIAVGRLLVLEQSRSRDAA